MARYAHIIDRDVVNVVELDPASDWRPDGGYVVESDVAQIGWRYENGVFTDPTPPPPPPPTQRRAVRKLLVVDRLIAAGLAEAAMQGFAQSPIAKLRFDAASDLWADDADVIGFLTAIGADPDAILAPE